MLKLRVDAASGVCCVGVVLGGGGGGGGGGWGGVCFFFKQKTAYEIMPSLVGSEMCIRDRDLEEQRQAARTLMEVFDTYCPGTYLYQAEDLYGIRDGLEWDMTYCENQIMPFRAGDLLSLIHI